MGVQQLENQDQRPHTLSPDQPGTPASGYYGDRAQSSPSSTRRSRLANRAPEPLIQESYECPPNPKVWAPPTPMSPYQRFENTFNSSYWSQNRQIWTPTRRAYETRLDKITVDTYLPQPHLDKGTAHCHLIYFRTSLNTGNLINLNVFVMISCHKN